MATDDDQTGGGAIQPRRRILCLTGPESTGKSTLAAALAERLGAALIPEVARSYLAGRSAYSAEDVLKIARQQVDLEAEILAEATDLVVCDTDLTVIQVWWEEKYGNLPAELQQMLAARAERAYLLMSPDLPWEPDPLRENSQDRERLFRRYRQLLESGASPYQVITGRGEVRFTRALVAISELMPELSF